MSQILYWDDIQEGDRLPELPKNATTEQLVKWAGSSLDFYQIHYDKDFALANELPGLIIHGALKNAWLAQLVTDWIGAEGTLRKLKVQYRGMDGPGDPLLCKGTVSKKYVDNDRLLVDCEIWLENSKGEKTTPGSATVQLPPKGA